MTKPSRPDVSDPHLRAALDGFGEHIENYTENLDLVSKDIKGIEQYLTTSGVRIGAGVKIGHTEEFTDGDYDIFRNYSGGVARDVERIDWAPLDEREERWRLMYVKYRRFGQVEISEGIALAGPTFTDFPETLDRRPLIEAPVEVRLRGHRVLPQLVREISSLVEVRRVQQDIQPYPSI